MVVAKKWVLVKHFDGFPKESDLELQTEELPDEVKDGEILCEAVYLSVDPYMRPYTARFPAGIGMIGEQLARVIASKHKDYPVNSLLLAAFGWRSHTLVDFNKPVPVPMRKVSSYMGDLSPSLALGAMGMPGATAYFGTMKLLEPKEGETFLVNAAAGAVGSLVGQIAKIKGCKVIGCAGSDAKCDWLRELGFDHVFNYKTADLSKELKTAAPDGIDCYFDNVGGSFSHTVVRSHMKKYGRISICGSISQYNTKPVTEESIWGNILSNELRIEGFIVTRWLAEYESAHKEIAQWINEGKIKIKEQVTESIENMPKAFIGLFIGENIGKAVVKA